VRGLDRPERRIGSVVASRAHARTRARGRKWQSPAGASRPRTLTPSATGNTLSSVATGDFVVVSLLGSAFDTGYTLDARIQNNTIAVANGLTADGSCCSTLVAERSLA
jgi:hypothetical protein